MSQGDNHPVGTRSLLVTRQRLVVSLGAIVSVEEAADLLGMPEGETWLREEGLVRVINGLPRVVWADVVDTIRNADNRAPKEAEFMTTADVAKMFNVSLDMVAMWRAEHGLPHARLGHRSIRYDRAQVLAWARQTAVASSKEQTHGLGEKEGRRVPRRLSLPMPADREIEEIPPHDWNPKQEGG